MAVASGQYTDLVSALATHRSRASERALAEAVDACEALRLRAVAAADRHLEAATAAGDYEALRESLTAHRELASEAVVASAVRVRDRLKEGKRKESQRLRKMHAGAMGALGRLEALNSAEVGSAEAAAAHASELKVGASRPQPYPHPTLPCDPIALPPALAIPPSPLPAALLLQAGIAAARGHEGVLPVLDEAMGVACSRLDELEVRHEPWPWTRAPNLNSDPGPNPSPDPGLLAVTLPQTLAR